MNRRSILQNSALYVILIAYTLITLVPLAMMFFSAMKPTRDIFLKPFSLPSWPPYLRNYVNAWQKADFSTYMGNSVLISVISVTSIIFIASMAAYVLSRYRFPGRRFLYIYFLSGLVLPARLAVIPLFILMRDLNLLDTRTSLVLVYAATQLPFSIFLLSNFFHSIPGEVEESARIDGAGPFQIYFRIMLPLLRPALATVGIFSFVNVWNDFFFPLIFIESHAKRTIPLGISTFFGEYSVQWDMLFAALNIAVIPVILVFLFASRQFIRGLTAGAIK